MISKKLNDLYQIYLKYKNNELVVEFAKEYDGFDEKRLPQLKCISRFKIRALGSIIKIHQESDDFEIQAAITNFWFELRSEWIRHNTVNNYNMVTTGTADEVSIIISSFVSAMIEDVEKLIDEEELKKMHQIMVSVQNGMF